jgi:DNA-binding transcriptional LysR family regulator
MMVFAKVLETGSYSQAAHEMGMAKSTVSRKITELEEHLGVRLLNRTTRRLNVTEEGKALYTHCQTITRELELAKQTLTSYSLEPQGTLRISVSPLFGNAMIAPLLPAFQKRHPALNIELIYSERHSDLIGEGYDLSLRMGELTDSNLVAIKLFTVKSILCASPGYLDKAGTPEQPADIEGHDFIRWLGPSTPPYANLTFYKGNKAFITNISSKFSSNDAQATREIAMNGGGLALLPNYAIQKELDTGKLIALLPEYKIFEFPVSLVYPHRKQAPPKTKAFTEYLREVVSTMQLATE